MILIVSNKDDVQQLAKAALEGIGLRVVGHASADEALQVAEDDEPELVLADLGYYGPGSSDLRTAYVNRFPERQTLFAIIAEPTDMAAVAAALETGVDDFLTAPLDAAVLTTRVRLLLQRNRMGIRARFRGDLAQLPLVQVIQFCERNALTGNVKFDTPKGRVQVRFAAGQIAIDGGDPTDKLAELMALDSGTFVIESSPMAFQEIENARMLSMPPHPRIEVPIGRLSGVRVGTRQFRIQTEYDPQPPGRIVSIVILGERVVKKQESTTPASISMDQLWVLVDEQHFSIEQSVRDTIDGFFKNRPEPWPEVSTGQLQQAPRVQEPVRETAIRLPARPQPGSSHPEMIEVRVPRKIDLEPESTRALPAPPPVPTTPRAKGDSERSWPVREDSLATTISSNPPDSGPSLGDDKEELFDMGLRKWRLRDFDGALVLLEAARALDPSDRAVQACVRAVRRKLANR
ncbi:MAG: DUF4388 domain-containing protein [Deltaproteobacteria bacterium]|nr:DUF4388 domain-containing protein [Deltaproteobacteria bacterium]